MERHSLAPGASPESLPMGSSAVHSTQGRQESGHYHLGKMGGQVSVPFCFPGTTSSVGSPLVKLKACASSLTFAEPLTTPIQEIT